MITIDELQIVEVWEQPEKVYEFATGAPRPSKGKRSECRREVAKVQLGLWGERVEAQPVDSELLEVRERLLLLPHLE